MLNILIADDHSIVSKGLEQIILSEWPDAFVCMVDNGTELLAKATDTKWNLIITDISMPGINGIVALQQLKQNNSKIPVLVMSMFSAEEYASTVFQYGASGYIEKTNVHSHLVDAIKTILGGSPYFAPEIAHLLQKKSGKKLLHETLSQREFLVMKELALGNNLSAIAQELGITLSSVSTYRLRVLGKMNVQSNVELTKYCLKHQIIQ
jgi:DNA-binding NarL/FixJ family response regulator